MPSAKIFMAFDYGERRTGVALGQELTGTARPLTTLTSSGKHVDWKAIEALLDEWQPVELIVGIPENSEDNKSIRMKIEKFCKELHSRFNLPVQLHDETLTSNEAYQHLKQKRNRTKGRIDKMDIDQYAAAILLESWMSNQLIEK